jgi:hypothetical protein
VLTGLTATFAALIPVTLVLLTLASRPAAADDYTSRPITLVIPLPPGGTNDIMARSVADKMSAALGQQIIVEKAAPRARGYLAEALDLDAVAADVRRIRPAGLRRDAELWFARPRPKSMPPS